MCLIFGLISWIFLMFWVLSDNVVLSLIVLLLMINVEVLDGFDIRMCFVSCMVC